MWYRQRRHRGGIWFFPLPFFFGIFFFAHSLSWLLFSMLFIAVMMLLVRAAFFSAGTGRWNRNGYMQQPYRQGYQPPYYQPPQPMYRPYGQGYGAQQQPRQEEPQPPSSEYAAYEQPTAQYPQEMPPMQ